MSVSMGTVVVDVTPQFRRHEQSGLMIGRYKELGLYAHGVNRDEVLSRLKVMFQVLIEDCRTAGDLRQYLDSRDVAWCTIDEADQKGIAYEDLQSGERVTPNVGPSGNGIVWEPLVLAPAA